MTTVVLSVMFHHSNRAPQRVYKASRGTDGAAVVLFQRFPNPRSDACLYSIHPPLFYRATAARPQKEIVSWMFSFVHALYSCSSRQRGRLTTTERSSGGFHTLLPTLRLGKAIKIDTIVMTSYLPPHSTRTHTILPSFSFVHSFIPL